MAYSNLINRSGTESLMPEEVSREIIQGLPQMSAVMQLGRRLPDMSRAQRRMPVLASLITAHFVQGDTGLKKTEQMQWEDKFIDAEELAVIVPIPENVLADSDYDIWGEVRPRIIEAFGVAFDQAVFYSTNKPQSWPVGIVPGATAASNTVTLGAGNDLYDDVMGDGGVIAQVETDGYMASGHVGAIALRSKLRALRTTDGVPIFNRTVQAPTDYELDGAPVIFPRNGSIDPTESLLISGDFDQLVFAMRQDITYKIATEGVLTDAQGTVTFNLFQQDMVALRAVMRLGWQIPNPINRINQNASTRYPFGVLLPT